MAEPKASPSAREIPLQLPEYTGGVLLDSRLLELWAAGRLSHGALRVYVYACMRREAHGAVAKIGDREMAERARVARKANPGHHLALPDYVAELEAACGQMADPPFSVVRQPKFRTRYVVPRPPRDRGDIGSGPMGRTRPEVPPPAERVDNSQSGPMGRTSEPVDKKTVWPYGADQSGPMGRTSLQEGLRTPLPPSFAGGPRQDPPPARAPEPPVSGGRPEGQDRTPHPAAAGSPPSPGGGTVTPTYPTSVRRPDHAPERASSTGPRSVGGYAGDLARRLAALAPEHLRGEVLRSAGLGEVT